MNIAIGCDEAAYELKEILKKHLQEKNINVVDYGTETKEECVLYPDVALDVATAIQNKECERGVLLCGTGIGMAITANKVKGIRAACCHDAYSAERSRKSNDAQIITMGARVIAPQLATYLLDVWLNCEFSGAGSTAKVEKIKEYENEHLAV
ncbi:ribose 5-phosphate isomerase B [Vibrio sp. CAIM 722]|uniref:Ribose 5-phosphate isomerase B n=1 Tax=Vibrio eleionomae TaxID=2653505 RepID=A0A7X4RTQ7_9VIBR|nr:ribose 5-phosphate isomerase B [Vibrio eleionomae]MZI93081.1 ribose 5-phosphate isomerase B [Vibrio eleionomae]